MITRQYCYTIGSGWNSVLDPTLDSERTLILVYCAPETVSYAPPFNELRKAFPNSQIMGCSTAGEICEGELHDESIVACVIKFEHTLLRSISSPVSLEGSYEAGRTLGAQLAADDLRAVIVLCDGHDSSPSALVQALNDTLPQGVIVTGGLAGNGFTFMATYTFLNSSPTESMVCAVGLYGDQLGVGFGSMGGWDKFGHERTITRSSGNVLYDLDGKPALDVYRDYVGEKLSSLREGTLLFPLAVRPITGKCKPTIRTILSIDEEAKSMRFGGDVPQGDLAQLMYANFDRLVQGAALAATEAKGDREEPVLAIAVSCACRRLVLTDRTEDEIEATLEALPPGSHLVGFYSYGEISPDSDGHILLHNQSMTLTTLWESEPQDAA